MNPQRIPLITAIVFLLPFMATYAQWNSDPASNNPICRAGNNQKAVRLVGDGKGGAIICWTDERSAQNFSSVYVQRIDRDGFVRWTENGITLGPVSESKARPEIISDDAGGAIIVWSDARNGNADIFAQRIDSSGNVLWQADGVPVASGSAEQTDPKLVSDGQHGAIVTWSAHTGNNQDSHIHAQRINGSGNLQWSPELVLSFSDQFESMPCITSDGSGGAYIAWAFYNNQEYDVYAQRVLPNGSQQWQSGGILFTSPSGAQDSPSLVADGTGKAFLTYYDWGSGSTPTLQVVVVNPDGSTAASLRATSTSGGQRNPRLSNVGTGLLGIVWEDGRVGGKTRSYAQIIDNTGKKSWAADGVEVSNRTGNQATPFIISDGNGGVIVSWEDMTAGITEGDIYAQRISSAGSLLWTSAGVPVSTAGRMQQFPWMTGDGENGAIIAWDDYRPSFSNSEIYASRILADGTFPLEPPILTFSSKLVAFGTVSVGFPSTKTITLSNTGDEAVTIASVTSTDPHFSLTPENSTIAPNSSVTAQVRFEPTSKDALTAAIVIESNSVFSPDTVVVTGAGSATAEIEVDRRSLNFGNVGVGTSAALVLAISNPGNDTLRISSITTSNPVFTVAIDSRDILPGENFADTVRFTPIAPGRVTGELTLNSNAPTSPTVVSLVGEGTLVEVTLSIAPTYIYFGDIPLGESKDTTLTVTNTGNDTLRISSFSSGDPHFTVETAIENIAPAGSRTFTIRFAPTAEGSLNKFLILTSNALSSPDTLVVQGAGIKIVSAPPLQVVPAVFTLHRNYPNPFRPSTTIRYDLEASAPVRLTVHDALGRLVATLVDETQRPGAYTVRWAPVNPVPGVYFLALRVDAEVASSRMVLMK